MAIFKAFKPEGLAKIAKSMGYEGSLDNFSRFIEEKPERQVKAIQMEEAAKMMAGGLIRMQEGGAVETPASDTIPQQAVPQQEFKQVTKAMPEFQIKGTDLTLAESPFSVIALDKVASPNNTRVLLTCLIISFVPSGKELKSSI